MADDSSKIVGVLNSIEEAIQSASSALDDINEKALKGGLGFDTLVHSVENSTKVFRALTDSVGDLGSALTLGMDFGLVSGSLSKLGDLFDIVVGGAAKLAGILDSTGQAIDSVTGYSRMLNATLFESVAKFNGSFEAAKKFSDYIISSAQKYATAEFGFISPADRIAAVKSLEQASIPLQHMSDTITSAAGNMDLLNTAFLQSKALGLDLQSYMDLLSNAMNIQGLSSQKAAEQLSLFGDVSSNTGIRVDKVARSLEGVATKFSKLGLTANFGKPILEGFTSSLTSMGLGFENAIELSEGLSSSLAKLTSDYSTAYITFQRGGLDFGGGGGALGASIGLRAELLKAKEGQADQGQIATQLADAVKKTISSFTGGQIITVQQAAENPALQQNFFTQTQLLKGLYGIAETEDQDRTLELLQQLGDATKSGDTNLQDSLGKELQNVLTSQDSTLSYAEKTSKFTESTVAELQEMNKTLTESFRLTGDSLAKVLAEFQKNALHSPEAQQIMEDVNAKGPDQMKFDFGDALAKLESSTGDGLEKLATQMGSFSDIGNSVANALNSMTLKVSNQSGDEIMDAVKSSIDNLAQQIAKYISAREKSGLFGP